MFRIAACLLAIAVSPIAVSVFAQDADLADLDRHYSVNVRAPYALTKALLPLICSNNGEIVFINSSIVQNPKPYAGQYGITKHALKGMADSLRIEVNALGIRVLSVFVGRTATPMQKMLFQREGRAYHPERLLQPEEVASVVIHALSLPRTAEVTEIWIRSMLKP